MPSPARRQSTGKMRKREPRHDHRTHPSRADHRSGAPSAAPSRSPAASVATRTELGPNFACESVSGRSRSPTTSGRSPASRSRRVRTHLALRPAAAGPRRRRHPARTMNPGWTRPGARREPRPASSACDPARQGRLRQPDALLQGPRRGHRRRGRPRLRLHHARPAPPPATWPARSAAAAARAGLDSCVFIPPDLETGSRRRPRSTAAELIAIDGTYDDVNRFCCELIGDELGESWGFVNVNLRPYYAEGSKTLAYEIAEQLGWRLPEQIVVPVASGSQLTKIDKGFRSWSSSAWSRTRPTRSSAPRRPAARPVSAAYKAGIDVVRPVSSRTPSPSRWRSATRPTAPTCSTSPGAPAARSRT